MAKTKKVTVSLIVDAPVKMKPERVAELIKICIEVGMIDAAKFVNLGNLCKDALNALSLGIEEPKAIA